ncbi:N-acetylneuraminate synthase family protein [bacterium]|nr:N-acetylneuraminate synthase family protein [bacterium]
MEKIKIANKLIGKGEPVFIIAEVGQNHNGDMDLAKRLIKEAARAGADAVKFQTIFAEGLVAEDDPGYERLKALEFGPGQHQELSKAAKEAGIIFFSTPFDEEGVDLLGKIDVPAYKIASGDLTNLPLIEYVAQKRRPVIISTGAAGMEEVQEAVAAVGHKEIILLHCVSNYPARLSDTNLRAIQEMEETFKVIVGFSDHTRGIIASMAAVALGASVIEKHFTLYKALPGPDHCLSLDPEEFQAMVRDIRMVEEALGNPAKEPAASELPIQKLARRGLKAKIEIKEGESITGEMVAILRPETGIEPKHIKEVMGRRAKKTIKKNEAITWSALDFVGKSRDNR